MLVLKAVCQKLVCLCGLAIDVCAEVAPVTCIVVTRVKSIVRMRVGSVQTVELSSGGLRFLQYYALVF